MRKIVANSFVYHRKTRTFWKVISVAGGGGEKFALAKKILDDNFTTVKTVVIKKLELTDILRVNPSCFNERVDKKTKMKLYEAVDGACSSLKEMTA